LVNSTNLCLGAHRAKAAFAGQNGKVRDWRPKLQVRCPKRKGGAKKGGRR